MKSESGKVSNGNVALRVKHLIIAAAVGAAILTGYVLPCGFDPIFFGYLGFFVCAIAAMSLECVSEKRIMEKVKFFLRIGLVTVGFASVGISVIPFLFTALMG